MGKKGNKRLKVSGFSEENVSSSDTLSPRSYQLELLSKAKEKNTIAYLQTGAGKTYMAVMLIKEKSGEICVPWESGGKRTFFIVNSVNLVMQQGEYIEKHTTFKVGKFSGSTASKIWSKNVWDAKFAAYQVLVMTGQIFLNILNHGFLKLSRVNMIIFDESHHGAKNHPYRKIMNLVMDPAFTPPHTVPHILGLTGSIVNKKCNAANVQKKIHQLELTFNSTVQTVDPTDDFSKYRKRPKEIIYVYATKVHFYDDWIRDNITDPLNVVLTNLHNYANRDGLARSMETRDRSKNESHNLQLVAKLFSSIVAKYGLWCALQALDLLIKDLSKNMVNHKEDPSEEDSYKYLISYFNMFRIKLSPLATVRTLPELFSISTPKLLTLVKILSSYHTRLNDDHDDSSVPCQTAKSTESRSGTGTEVTAELDGTGDTGRTKFRAIIFVHERSTAFLLHTFLKRVASLSPNLAFIKSGYILGKIQSNHKMLLKAAMPSCSRENALKMFRDGTINILISTSIIDEGIDIPECNLVIRFDLPLNFRSYMQSKGRTRADTSYFLLLVEDINKDACIQNLKSYAVVEHLLPTKCIKRELPTYEESRASHLDDSVPPYIPEVGEGKPRITQTSAMSVINWYCSHLPGSQTPTYKTHTRSVATSNGDFTKTYQTTLTLPESSLVKLPIVGEIMTHFKDAQMSAALKACERLHRAGELNDHLLPYVSQKYTQRDVEIKREYIDHSPHSSGDEICSQFSDGFPIANQPCFLYELDTVVLENDSPSLTKHRAHPSPTFVSKNIGIITRRSIPMIPDLIIHTPVARLVTKIKLISKTLLLDPSHIQKLESFRDNLSHIGTVVLDASGGTDWEIFYALTDNKTPEGKGIDWTAVDAILASRDLTDPLITSTDSERFVGTVVTRVYDTGVPRTLYFVKEVSSDLTTKSFVPGSLTDTFETFYNETYGTKLINPTQDLLKVVSLIDHFKGNGGHGGSEFQSYLVPELSSIHPLPVGLWLKMAYLPHVTRRINRYLVEENVKLGRRVGTPNDAKIAKNCESFKPDIDSFNWMGSAKVLPPTSSTPIVRKPESKAKNVATKSFTPRSEASDFTKPCPPIVNYSPPRGIGRWVHFGARDRPPSPIKSDEVVASFLKKDDLVRAVKVANHPRVVTDKWMRFSRRADQKIPDQISDFSVVESDTNSVESPTRDSSVGQGVNVDLPSMDIETSSLLLSKLADDTTESKRSVVDASGNGGTIPPDQTMDTTEMPDTSELSQPLPLSNANPTSTALVNVPAQTSVQNYRVGDLKGLLSAQGGIKVAPLPTATPTSKSSKKRKKKKAKNKKPSAPLPVIKSPSKSNESFVLTLETFQNFLRKESSDGKEPSANDPSLPKDTALTPLSMDGALKETDLQGSIENSLPSDIMGKDVTLPKDIIRPFPSELNVPLPASEVAFPHKIPLLELGAPNPEMPLNSNNPLFIPEISVKVDVEKLSILMTTATSHNAPGTPPDPEGCRIKAPPGIFGGRAINVVPPTPKLVSHTTMAHDDASKIGISDGGKDRGGDKDASFYRQLYRETPQKLSAPPLGTRDSSLFSRPTQKVVSSSVKSYSFKSKTLHSLTPSRLLPEPGSKRGAGYVFADSDPLSSDTSVGSDTDVSSVPARAELPFVEGVYARAPTIAAHRTGMGASFKRKTLHQLLPLDPKRVKRE